MSSEETEAAAPIGAAADGDTVPPPPFAPSFMDTSLGAAEPQGSSRRHYSVTSIKSRPSTPTTTVRKSIIGDVSSAWSPTNRPQKSMSAVASKDESSAVFDREILGTNLRNVKDSHIYNLSQNVASKINTQMSIKSFSNFQHLCDGSHSHIYFAETDGEFMENDVVNNIKLESEPPRKVFSCGNSKWVKAVGESTTIDIIIKRITNKSGEISRALQDFQLELDILSRVRHPHIIKIIGAGVDYDKNSHNYILDNIEISGLDEPEVNSATKCYPFLLLEQLGGGSLGQYLSMPRAFHSKPLSQSLLLKYAYQLIDALEFLHYGFDKNCSIIHRDLKPDNIGFTASRQLKILDFGLSIVMKRGEHDATMYQMTGNTGTLRYMAPEVARLQPYNEKVDMYSYALIVWQMATGVVPYGGNIPHEEFMRTIVNGHERPHLDIDDFGRVVKAPQKLLKLLEDSWKSDIPTRLSSAQAKAVCKEVLNEFGSKSSSCTLQ